MFLSTLLAFMEGRRKTFMSFIFEALIFSFYLFCYHFPVWFSIVSSSPLLFKRDCTFLINYLYNNFCSTRTSEICLQNSASIAVYSYDSLFHLIWHVIYLRAVKKRGQENFFFKIFYMLNQKTKFLHVTNMWDFSLFIEQDINDKK